MAKKKKAKAARSEIIEQCVIYVQAIAAFDAAFKADHTGDLEYASHNRFMRKAHRAMVRLVALSPAHSDRPPLSALELLAKAAVLENMVGLTKGEQPDEIETTYILNFAHEVGDYFGSIVGSIKSAKGCNANVDATN
jgi:hypothetical protein